MFSKLSKWVSQKLGHSNSFITALILVIIWLIMGPFYDFNDSWELFINTVTTIITFLMVFLIQNTQNRDTMALHLKLDEIIRSIKSAHNELLKIEELTDEDLGDLKKRYGELAKEIKRNIKEGQSDLGTPDFKK